MSTTTKQPLKSGYTTGSCAAAAACGAAQMLAQQRLVSAATISLPGGEVVTFPLHGQQYTPDSASCHVIKDAGDDPDITNGAEIHAAVTVNNSLICTDTATVPPAIRISGGTGIGTVTKPGLAIPPGEWAINPVPRQMIASAVSDWLPASGTLDITIAIPDGEQRAKKTLNERLGIIGGLSILGTTGIVRPISAKAWTDTIDAALDVARACGCENVLLSTGRTSELSAQRFLQAQQYPEESYIMMGDHIAYALRSCIAHGYLQPLIACQFAKLFKIACGYENTHAAVSELDLQNFARWAEAADFPSACITAIKSANTAREIIIESNFDHRLLELACNHAQKAAVCHAPGISPRFLVADYSGNIVFSR